MNKAELVAGVAEITNLTKKDSETAVNAVVEMVSKALEAGDDVQLIGFGTFGVRQTAARTGRNPQTGAPIDIPAKKVPNFKPGKNLKERVSV